MPDLRALALADSGPISPPPPLQASCKTPRSWPPSRAQHSRSIGPNVERVRHCLAWARTSLGRFWQDLGGLNQERIGCAHMWVGRIWAGFGQTGGGDRIWVGLHQVWYCFDHQEQGGSRFPRLPVFWNPGRERGSWTSSSTPAIVCCLAPRSSSRTHDRVQLPAVHSVMSAAPMLPMSDGVWAGGGQLLGSGRRSGAATGRRSAGSPNTDRESEFRPASALRSSDFDEIGCIRRRGLRRS